MKPTTGFKAFLYEYTWGQTRHENPNYNMTLLYTQYSFSGQKMSQLPLNNQLKLTQAWVWGFSALNSKAASQLWH